MSEEFVGAGWAFPMRIDSGGGVALVRREREIEEAVRLILGTAYGERPMRPEFGCGIHDYVFAPSDATTAGRIAYEITRSLERWEPRIDVVDVAVTTDAADAATLYIDISYQVSGSNDPRNLVFPFYVIPSEGPEALASGEATA
jgi:phage baseplate assembly protein W